MTLAADSIVTGANLITLDESLPRATAMAIRDGRIVFVGDDRGAEAMAGPETERLDLDGRTVTPGFIDAHVHLMSFGLHRLRQADLVGCKSLDELLERLAENASRHEGWIQGHGFDQSKLLERRFPTRQSSTVCRRRGRSSSRASAGTRWSSTRRRWRCWTPVSWPTATNARGFTPKTASTRFTGGSRRPVRAKWSRRCSKRPRVALRTASRRVQTLLDTPDQMAAYARLRRKGSCRSA